jgi:hypothetical protein
MEPLTLHFPFDKEEFVRINTYRLKLGQKPSWRYVHGTIIFSALFTAITVFFYSTAQPNPAFLIVSIVSCIITLAYGQSVLAGSKRYLKRINEIAREWDEKKMDCIYEFKDEGIHYSDKERVMNLKWNVFRECLTNSNYIIFMTGETFDAAYFMSRRKIDAESWEKILKFAEAHLTVNKIEEENENYRNS